MLLTTFLINDQIISISSSKNCLLFVPVWHCRVSPFFFFLSLGLRTRLALSPSRIWRNGLAAPFFTWSMVAPGQSVFIHTFIHFFSNVNYDSYILYTCFVFQTLTFIVLALSSNCFPWLLGKNTHHYSCALYWGAIESLLTSWITVCGGSCRNRNALEAHSEYSRKDHWWSLPSLQDTVSSACWPVGEDTRASVLAPDF